MKLKYVLLVVAAIGVGFVSGRQTATTTAPANVGIETPDENQPPKNLENLQKLVDVDLQEYYRLKSEEARYKKADEILSKIITIFLADLGMKISKPDLTNQNSEVASQAQPQTLPVQATPFASAKKQEKPSPLIARGSLVEIRSPDEIAEFLKASPTENFEDAVRTSSAFSNKSGQLQSLGGQFVGTAVVVERGKPERWGIEMRLNAKMTEDKITGRRSLKLSRNGKVFSDSSGRGGLDQEYREISADPEAIVIAAGPNTFLQAYYVRSTDQVIGHIMKKGGISEPYKSIGTFELSRQ